VIESLIGSGRIGYVIIALTVLEIAGLLAYRRLTLAAMLPNILAGDFILLAWPLGRSHWTLSALCLLGALVSHGTDMLRRLR
jgi:hypothetical protein